MNRRPTALSTGSIGPNGSARSHQNRHTRLTALLVALSLLLGMVLGSGWMRVSRAVDSLSNSLITQMILQDICHGHPERQLTAHTPPAGMTLGAQALQADNERDEDKQPDAGGKHTHCAACLIALDIALPEHGGTWRLKAAELAEQRGFVSHAPLAVKHRIKPPSHAPPAAV